MTTTTILVHTSAESAILDGCQHGWHRVHLDTQALTPEQRVMLAKSVKEDQGARYVCGPWYANPRPYDVSPPTAEGLIAHLQDRLDREAEQAAERQAEIDCEIESYRQVLAAIERGQWLPDSVGVDVDVTWCLAPNYAREVPEAQSLWARIEAAKKSRREDLWAARSLTDRIATQGPIDLESARERYPDIVAETERRIEEIEREREAAAAREQEEYDRFYTRLPETLRARHEAGYAGAAAIEGAIRALIIEDSRADANWAQYVSESCDVAPKVRAESLTDDEFARLRAIEEVAPEGAKVTARIVGWREATDQEIEDDLADSNGLVRDETPYAVVQWERVGVIASVVIPL